MPDTHARDGRNSSVHRALHMPSASHYTRLQFRLAQAIVIVGSLAMGTLLVNRLVDLFSASFAAYYGVSNGLRDDQHFGAWGDVSLGELSLTSVQIAIALIATVGIAWFVTSERRRARRLAACHEDCARQGVALATRSLCGRELFDMFIVRTSAFGGILLTYWMLQSCLQHMVEGGGWQLGYDGWSSLLPLASIFGVCLLVGTFVALISMVGMRAIFGLRAMFDSLRRQIMRIPAFASAWCNDLRVRNVRDLFGYEILSRPPPRERIAVRISHDGG